MQFSLVCALICNKPAPCEITYNYKRLRCYIYLFFGGMSFWDALYIAWSSVYIHKPGSYIINTLLFNSLKQDVFIGYNLDINLLHYGFPA